jgi:hypothetical protein
MSEQRDRLASGAQVWLFCPLCRRIVSGRAHATQKLVDLMRRAILNHLKRGEAVYDPFLVRSLVPNAVKSPPIPFVTHRTTRTRIEGRLPMVELGCRPVAFFTSGTVKRSAVN